MYSAQQRLAAFGRNSRRTPLDRLLAANAAFEAEVQKLEKWAKRMGEDWAMRHLRGHHRIACDWSGLGALRKAVKKKRARVKKT